MAVREILLLGHPGLYTRCAPVQQSEVGVIQTLVQDLHDTMMDFQVHEFDESSIHGH